VVCAETTVALGDAPAAWVYLSAGLTSSCLCCWGSSWVPEVPVLRLFLKMVEVTLWMLRF